MQVRRFFPARAITIVAAALLIAPDAAAQPSSASSVRPDELDVSVIIRTEGQQTQRQVVDFTATPFSHVVVVRVNSFGNIEVLYPKAPSAEQALVRSGKAIRVSSLANRKAFFSEGSVFAFVSRNPFDFSRVSDRSGWNNLHLASYWGSSAEAVARTFLDEISDRSSRVVMTNAVFSNAVAGTKSPEPLAWLSEFRNQPCPTLATQRFGQVGSRDECLLQGFRMPARTSTGSSPTKQRLDPMKQ